MTTTERLRELYQEFEKSDGHSNEHAWAAIQIADHTPAMLAVIEAAEAVERVWHKNIHIINSELDLKVAELLLKLAAFREVRE